MYEILKKLARNVLPNSFFVKYENGLRSLVTLRYKGDQYLCNICETSLSRFIELNNHELLCPKCGSLPRTRRLWLLIQDELSGKKILHFSPPKSLKKKIESHVPTSNYLSTDFEGEFESETNLDITNIKLDNASYDLIICYHVLEHIVEDQKAMQELYRVLTPQGKLYLQTPFKDGGIYEDYAMQSKAERLKHFGQEDHVRIYSVSGLKARLEENGFHATPITFQADKNQALHGLKIKETVFLLTKSQA